MSAINQCPFCKSNFLALSWTGGNDLWYVLCLNCHAHSGYFSTQDKAIQSWNKGGIYRKYSNLHNS